VAYAKNGEKGMNDQVSAPEVAAAEAPQVGMIARFVAVFTDPRKAFSSIRRNHEWLVLLIILSIVGIASYQMTKPLIIKSQLENLEERLSRFGNLPAERKQEIMDQQAEQLANPLWQFLTPVFYIVVLMVGSGILLFLGNIIMGGETKFLLVLNMFALSWLVTIPETIIKVPLMLSKGSAKVQTSLALLLPADQSNTFLGTILGKFDIFGLWQLALVIFGLSILTKASVNKSAWAVGITWFIWVIIQGGLASLGFNLGG
jgi:hypothetical protein